MARTIEVNRPSRFISLKFDVVSLVKAASGIVISVRRHRDDDVLPITPTRKARRMARRWISAPLRLSIRFDVGVCYNSKRKNDQCKASP